MHAATQQHLGTMRHSRGAASLPWLQAVSSIKVAPGGHPMTGSSKPRQFHIHGVTKAGKVFRPSDWAERLAGAMSSFRPAGAQGGTGAGAFIGYSPYCVPQVIDEIRCVLVSEALREIEPMAWDFVMNFARDNDLAVAEVSAPSEPAAKT